MLYLRRFWWEGPFCQLSLCLGLALRRLFVLDFQFGRMGDLLYVLARRCADIPYIHFCYIFDWIQNKTD
ncbi:hypothetical protein ERY13_06565 [Paenibacillus mucilaginosus]|nr:hypothetical protein ERY13_06565 [Paenibacillus mucilaginosus]